MTNILINGAAQHTIEYTDRGLQYGDGLFETIALVKGRLQLWPLHMQRMREGCKKLQLPIIEDALWLQDIAQLATSERCVIKLMLTRGSGGRGYRFPDTAQVTRIAAVYPWPDYPDSHAREGVMVTVCGTSASVNPALAGLKHLNRLENVLARNEWQDASIAEGLMCDDRGHVIEGSMSNVFAVKDGVLLTPQLNRAGVRGVMRAHVMMMAQQWGVNVQERDISMSALHQMDEIFLTNSLIGIWPVKQLQASEFAVGKITQVLLNNLKLNDYAQNLPSV
jgi:4-amino-4-deoxychorismate lyase